MLRRLAHLALVVLVIADAVLVLAVDAHDLGLMTILAVLLGALLVIAMTARWWRRRRYMRMRPANLADSYRAWGNLRLQWFGDYRDGNRSRPVRRGLRRCNRRCRLIAAVAHKRGIDLARPTPLTRKETCPLMPPERTRP